MACVTLEKNEQGYQIISNVLIPIPMYLDGPPNKVIPLQMETFLELPLLSKALLAPGAHSQFGSGKNTQFEPEQRANPFENVFSKTAVFPPPAIAETDL